jgi:TolA-binding protein
MKKFETVLFLGMLFLLCGLSVTQAAENNAPETGASGTPQEIASLQKTLRSDRMDEMEQSIAELTETVSALSDRVQDLERTVDDFNGKT